MFAIPSTSKFYRTEFISDSYAASPPAAFIYNEYGDNFSLGYTEINWNDRDAVNGHLSFNVLVNGKNTGEFASHIERRDGKVRIMQRNGIWKIWNPITRRFN